MDHYETISREVPEQVFDGYETEYIDLGNGQAETVQTPKYHTEYHTEQYQQPVYRTEPVYATKYYYTIDVWIYVDTMTASGDNKEPYWPATGLTSDVHDPIYGDKREGTRKEQFWVLFRDQKNNTRTVPYTYEDWLSIKLEDTITYKTFRWCDKPLK